MRALIQRVTHAQVDIDGKTVGSIGTGLLILLGVGTNDTEAQDEPFARRCVGRGARRFPIHPLR